MLNPAKLFFFCSFLALLMSFLWILYCTLESKTTEREFIVPNFWVTVPVMSCFPYKNKTCALSFRVLWSQITWFPRWVRSRLKWSFYSGVYMCALRMQQSPMPKREWKPIDAKKFFITSAYERPSIETGNREKNTLPDIQVEFFLAQN